MIRVSIIIPVYNAQSTLCATIESIKHQTYNDWECILVDDGSTDGSSLICDDVAKNDNRFVVIHKQNGGVSAARNDGIKAAKGKWITFVDSDDLLVGDFLEETIISVSRYPEVDICFAGYAIIGTGNTQIKTYNHGCYVGANEIHDLLSKTKILYRCSPWAKLFKKSIIIDNNICFDTNLAISEDRVFLYNCLLHTNSIAVSPNIGYIYYSISPNSLKHKLVPMSMLDYRQDVLYKLTLLLMDKFSIDKKSDACMIRHLMHTYSAGILNAYHQYGNAEQTVDVQNKFFSKHYHAELFNPCIPQNLSKAQKCLYSKNFIKYNRYQYYKDVRVKMSLALHKFLKLHSHQHPICSVETLN